MKKLLVLLLLLGWTGLARADAVLDWNETAASAAFAAGLDNPTDGCVDALHESRMFAMMHAAIHDALEWDRAAVPALRPGRPGATGVFP